MVMQFSPTLRARKDGSLVFGQPPLTRILALLAAAALAAIAFLDPGATSLSKVSWSLVAAILLVAALSVDSWTVTSGGLSRRFGVWPVLKRRDLGLDRLDSVGIRKGVAGDSPNGVVSDRDRMEASIFGMGRGDWVALVLVLDDGRKLALASAKPGKADRLKADGKAIAERLGLAFTDFGGD